MTVTTGRVRGFSVAALALASVLSFSAQAADDAVRVGSKIDTEGSLLGNIIIQVLEANGIHTTNKLQLERRKWCVAQSPPVKSISIRNTPATARSSSPTIKTRRGKMRRPVFDKVKKLDYDQNKIVWLNPSPANNTWTIAVRQDVASAHNLKSLGDLGKYISSGGDFKLAASAEFIERPDALPAFENAYGFKLNQAQLLSLAGGDTAVTIKAAAEQTSGVNAAMAYGTDGPVAALGLQTLEDPKGVQPIYAPAPVIREAALKAHPNIPELLKPVFASLDTKTLQGLNAKIAVDGQDAKKVAAKYLQEKGFVKK